MRATVSRESVFQSMFEAPQLMQVVDKIALAVESSYLTHPCNRTAAEDKRRASICVDAVLLMRGDMKWSTSRICDHVHEALEKKLDGVDFRPHTRSLWLPGDS